MSITVIDQNNFGIIKIMQIVTILPQESTLKNSKPSRNVLLMYLYLKHPA